MFFWPAKEIGLVVDALLGFQKLAETGVRKMIFWNFVLLCIMIKIVTLVSENI